MRKKLNANCCINKTLYRLAACTLLVAGCSMGQLMASPGTGTKTDLEQPAPDSKTVKGKIVNDKGEEIIGASIKEKGTTNGTISKVDGTFSLTTKSAEPTLIITYVGYKAQQVTVKGSGVVNVTLQEDSKMVDEVVVIGYGTQRKGDVTSAVASVKAEDFTVGKISDAAELVKGKIAGLSIVKASGDPNATSSIMLRGITTIKGDVEPLVLVDGIEGSLTTVAPDNIASIDVLKDASAAAIYGTRGANGVIIITTKTGKRGSKGQVKYSNYLSLSQWYKTAKFMDTNDVIYGKTNFTHTDGEPWYDTDWLKAVTRKAGYTQNHSLTLEGGSQTSTYSANITYNDEQGIMRKSDSRNLKSQLDITHFAMNDMLKFNFNVLYTTHKNTNNDNAYVYRQALIHNPASPVYNSDGSYFENTNLFQYYNPVEIQNELIGDTRSSNSRVTGNVTIEPIKGWQTNVMLSMKKREATSENYYTSKYYSQAAKSIRGTATKSSSNERSDNLEITSKYNLNINKFRGTALVGYSYLYNVNDGFAAGNSNFPSESYLYNSLGQGTYLTDDDHSASMSSYKNDDKLVGFFGRMSLGYDDKYNAMISVRREGSSKFGVNHKWGTFPSASVGWTISNEAFMKDQNWLNNLKLRSGYGVTGVIPSSSYLSITTYDYDTWGKHYSSDGEWTPSLKVAQNPNPDLKWEKTSEWNLGLDWAVVNSRISGTIDLYSKKTVDLLYDYSVPVPPNMYNSTTANVGKMSNKGIEVMLTAKPIVTKNFEWTSTITLSHNENKLLSLSNDLYQTDNFMEVGGVGDPISVPTHAMEVGHRLGDFWALKSVGMSENGKVLIQVSDGNGGWYVKEFAASDNKESNRQRVGNGLPQVYAGWNNTFRYMGFDLNLQFTGQFGYQILNAQRAFYENNSIAYNRLKSASNWYGAVDETGAAVIDAATGKQKMVQLSSSMPQGVWSDYIENGDFLKLSSATLGYSFSIPGTWKKYINAARIYVSGQNLFCITSYSGLDPEVSNYFLYPGIDDRDKYPTVRSYTVGLSLNF